VKTFKFPLQRVLDWRALQLRSEEEKLAGLQNRLAAIVAREKALFEAELETEIELAKSPILNGMDLQRFAAFQLGVRSEHASLKASRMQCDAQIVEQRKRLLKARKEVRVLEKLKEKRLEGWTYLNDREVETIAAEAYISKWARSEFEGGEV
jgi:flagellar export protein FliJ